jgi:hypothetical protein
MARHQALELHQLMMGGIVPLPMWSDSALKQADMARKKRASK